MTGFTFIVLGHVLTYCQYYSLPCVLTNVLADEGRTKVHSSGRGFDLRIHDWPEKYIRRLQKVIVSKAGHLGAYSDSDLKQRVVVRHDIGKGDHLHFQTRPM